MIQPPRRSRRAAPCECEGALQGPTARPGRHRSRRRCGPHRAASAASAARVRRGSGRSPDRYVEVGRGQEPRRPHQSPSALGRAKGASNSPRTRAAITNRASPMSRARPRRRPSTWRARAWRPAYRRAAVRRTEIHPSPGEPKHLIPAATRGQAIRRAKWEMALRSTPSRVAAVAGSPSRRRVAHGAGGASSSVQRRVVLASGSSAERRRQRKHLALPLGAGHCGRAREAGTSISGPWVPAAW